MVGDRKATLIAAACGGAAIGGFWVAQPSERSARVKVLNQWRPVSKDGLDGDAAALVRLELHGVDRDDERPLLFQIVGRDGAAYPLVPSATPGMLHTFKLPRGYTKRLDAPRLVVSRGRSPIASATLKPVPEPEHHLLTPSPPAPISLVYRGDWGLYAEPKRPIPRGERWWISLRGTSYAGGLDGDALVSPPGSRFGHRLAVPYANEAKLVEVDWTRYRFKEESDVIRLEGLRLTRQFGGTAVVVDQAQNVANRLGAWIKLPRQDNGPHHPVRRGDPLVANVNLILTPQGQSELSADLRQSRGPKIEILSPSPESLGLRELRIAGQSKTGREPRGPVREGPFSATVRITFFRAIPVETQRLVLPVAFGAPMPGRGLGYPSEMPLFSPERRERRF